MRVAVIGATGIVGSVLLEELTRKEFGFSECEILMYASPASVGKEVRFRGETHKVMPLKDVPQCEMAFFVAEEDVSAEWVPKFVNMGITVIDNSSVFRLEESVPLVVPEVNGELVKDKKLIANPNCSTIQLVVALAPLKQFGIKRVIVSSYQAVSGAGRDALIQMWEEMQSFIDLSKNRCPAELVGVHPFAGWKPQPFFGNVIPAIGKKVNDTEYREEYKIRHETRKILRMPNLPIFATAVRVPVINTHSESVMVELDRNPGFSKILDAFENAQGIKLWDEPITPVQVSGSRKVHISRLRADNDCDSTYHFWVVADNLRKGAATNAVQIGKLTLRSKNRSTKND